MHKDNLRYAVLGLVGARDSGVHGYQLKGELEALCNEFWEVNFGRLYRALDLLDQAGDLQVEAELQDGRPNRKVYRITEKGKQTLDDWLLQPVSERPRPLRDELVLKLLFLGRSNVEALTEQIRHQRSIYLGKLALIAQWKRRLLKSDMDGEVTSLVMDGMERRLRAEFAWLDDVTRKLVLHTRPDVGVKPSDRDDKSSN
jgi:PadR family transcriptional regulator AphA